MKENSYSYIIEWYGNALIRKSELQKFNIIDNVKIIFTSRKFGKQTKVIGLIFEFGNIYRLNSMIGSCTDVHSTPEFMDLFRKPDQSLFITTDELASRFFTHNRKHYSYMSPVYKQDMCTYLTWSENQVIFTDDEEKQKQLNAKISTPPPPPALKMNVETIVDGDEMFVDHVDVDTLIILLENINTEVIPSPLSDSRTNSVKSQHNDQLRQIY